MKAEMFSELETEERRSQQRRLRRHREAERTLGGPNVLRAKKKKKRVLGGQGIPTSYTPERLSTMTLGPW